MSLLKSKPRWCPAAVATDKGWVNSLSGELLISHRGLKTKLDLEQSLNQPVIVESVIAIDEVKEEIMNIQDKTKEETTSVKPEVIKEQTIKKPRKNQKIIAEVVEYNVKKVIGE